MNTANMDLKDILQQALTPFDNEVVGKWIASNNLPSFEYYIQVMVDKSVWALIKPRLGSEYRRLKSENKVSLKSLMDVARQYRPEIMPLIESPLGSQWFLKFYTYLDQYLSGC
jgi:hypothetical protein